MYILIAIVIVITSLFWVLFLGRNSTPYCNGFIETNMSLINIRDLKFMEKDTINDKPGIRIFYSNNVVSTFDFDSEQERDKSYNKIVEICKSYYEFVDKYN